MGDGKEQIKRLMELLPEGWQAQAKELGAFRRAREGAGQKRGRIFFDKVRVYYERH